MRFLNERTRQKLLRGFLSQESWQGLRQLPIGSVGGIMDVGAHVGMFSLLARFLHPLATIVAIEPHPVIHEVLKENVTGLDIMTTRACVGDGTPFWLCFDGVSKIGSHDMQNTFSPSAVPGEMSMPSYPLTYFAGLSGCGNDKLFWKIDIEGCEREYVTGNAAAGSLIAESIGFVIDIHGQWARQQAWWREQCGATHDVRSMPSRHRSGVVFGLRKDVTCTVSS